MFCSCIKCVIFEKKNLKFIVIIVFYNVCILLCNMYIFDFYLNLVFFCIIFFFGDCVVYDSMYSICLLLIYLDDWMLVCLLGVYCNERLSFVGLLIGWVDMKFLFGMV